MSLAKWTGLYLRKVLYNNNPVLLLAHFLGFSPVDVTSYADDLCGVKNSVFDKELRSDSYSEPNSK